MRNPRAAAALAVDAVLRGGQTLDAALARPLAEVPERDRGLVRELAAGALRGWPRIELLLAELSDRPLGRMHPRLLAVLAVGMHQLEDMRVPEHAAVDQTVRATAELGQSRARGMINAILRRYLRERDELAAALADQPAFVSAHPEWISARIREEWGEAADGILAAGNERPPMWLRVAADRTDRDAVRRALEGADLPCAAAPEEHGTALRLQQAVAVERIPGFDQGQVSVQDLSAQLAAPLLDPAPGMRVLDACAAPGGKTLHLLEHAPDLDLVALDLDAERLARVEANLERAARTATCTVGDASDPEGWWDGRPFDRILVDAPCSGSGVIRRHPDIKVLRREGDLADLAARQRAMLAACCELLAPRGRLLYATCSVFRCEGDDVVLDVLGEGAALRALAIAPAGSERTDHGARIASGSTGGDGFYYACLERTDRS